MEDKVHNQTFFKSHVPYSFFPFLSIVIKKQYFTLFYYATSQKRKKHVQ